MCRNVRAGLVVLMALLSISLASADDQSDSKSFTLQHLKPRDAATVVRTIAGIRHLAAPDDETIEISGTQVALHLTAELLSALDVPEIDPSQNFTTGDETVVAVIPLRDILPSEAMAALRELRLQRVAALVEPAVVVVRDTADQVKLAIAVLEKASS